MFKVLPAGFHVSAHSAAGEEKITALTVPSKPSHTGSERVVPPPGGSTSAPGLTMWNDANG